MQPRLFQLGNNHLLLNGDSIDSNHLAILHSAAGPLGLGKAELCLTDPPYGVNLGCAESRERERERERAVAHSRAPVRPYKSMPILNDNLKEHDMMHFLCNAIGGVLAMFSCSRLMMFYASSKSLEIFMAVRELNLPVKSVIIWLKDNITLCFSEFRPRTETIIYAGKTSSLRRNKNREQSDLLYCAIPRNNRRTKAAWYHPTGKPIKLLRDLLDAATIVGDVIIDPFAGTGSSLVAQCR